MFTATATYGASILTVPQGGTGAATLTGCLTGNGTGAITGTGSACGSSNTSKWATTTDATVITPNGGSTIGLIVNASSTFPQLNFKFATGTSATTSTLTVTNTASTSKFFADGLITCNSENMLTWAAGIFGCESDTSSAGGGAFAWTPTTYSSVNVNATSTGLWLKGTSPFSLIASSSLITNATSSSVDVTAAGQLTVQQWSISTTTTVCAYGCEYSSIQTAITAGRRDIVLKDETYAGPVSIVADDTRIRGAGMYSSLITCDAATNGLCVSIATTSELTRIRLEQFGIDNTNASLLGTGLDTSQTSNVYTDNIRITDFLLGHLHQDGSAQNAFYSTFNNMIYAGVGNCFKTASTTATVSGNLVNDNSMYKPRCALAATASTGIGYDIINSEGWTFYSPNAEPFDVVGTGFRVDGTSIGIAIISPWFESNATATEILAGALNTSITGAGRITANTIGVWNRGSHTILSGPLVSANTVNFDDSTFNSIYMTTDNDFPTAFIGVGTSTQALTDTRLTLAGSFSTALAPMMWINQNGAFASGYSGIGFGMQATGSSFPDGLGKIGCIPGTGFALTSCTWHVADAAGVSQERLRINQLGYVGIGTTSPYQKLSIGGGNLHVGGIITATSTATSTFTGGLNLLTNGLQVDTMAAGCAQWATGGFLGSTGSACGAGGGASPDWIKVVGNLLAITPSTTPMGVIVGASSTIDQLSARLSTTTSATTTNLFATLASTSRLFFNNASGTQQTLTSGFFQNGFTTGCTGNDSETVLYSAATGLFTCGTDSGSQTPWTAAIDGGGFALTNAGALTFTSFTATSTSATSSIRNALYVGSSTPTNNLMFAVGTMTPIISVDKNSGKVGFGTINTSPARYVFHSGTNANVNPNINFLVQDPTDARAGVSVGDDFIGLKSTGGLVGLFGFDYAAGLALNINMQEFGGNIGVASATPSFLLSVGSGNTGTFGISTSTDGCTQFTKGLLWITGSACGSGGGSTSKWATTTGTYFGIVPNGGNSTALGIGTATPAFMLQVGSSTGTLSGRSQLVISETNGGVNAKHWGFRSAGGSLFIGTTTDSFATSTLSALVLNGSGVPSLTIGTSTPMITLKNGSLSLGGGGDSQGFSGSTTISMGKIQIDGLNNTGARSCAFVVGTTWTVVAGACNP